MKLVNKTVLKSLPALYSQESVADPLVKVKFFSPVGSASWYCTEGSPVDENGQAVSGEAYDPAKHADFLFFGYVTGLGDDELGYISLNELASVKLAWGLGIERGLHFSPVRLSEIKKAPSRH